MFKFISSILQLLTCKKKQPKPQQDPAPFQGNSPDFVNYANKAKSLRKVSQENMLLLYALYKQATRGDCNLPEPYRMNFEDHAKWVAWTAVKGLSINEAEKQYIKTMTQLLPQQDEQLDEDNEDNDNQFGEQRQHQTMGNKVSVMKAGDHDTNEAYQQKMNQKEEELEIITLNEAEQDLFNKIEECLDEPDQLTKIIKSIDQAVIQKIIKAENKQSITLLHFVIDSENVEAFKILVKYYQDCINIKERVSGMTPLHYACLSGNEEIITILMKCGADPKIKDFSGADAFENIENNQKHLLEQ